MRHTSPRSWAVLSAVLLAGALCVPAAAQVRRCVGPDGQTTFTDRRCSELGAIEAPPEPPRPGALAGPVRAARCPATVQDLLYEVTSAVDQHDVNRLAGLYHWTGMSNPQAYRIMERLVAIADRPLVDVSPVFPRPADGADPELYPQTSVDLPPLGLRLEQTLANGHTPSRTHFWLKRHLGCLWISL